MRKPLKRFEKLEHVPKDVLIKQGLRISKRFERLEVGQRRLEFTITDEIAQQEESSPGVKYFLLCPYCGKENPVDSQRCADCSHLLQTRLAGDYQQRAKSLKTCSSCGTVNQQDKRNCWVCGKEFRPESPQEARMGSENVITVNIDGREFKSTDKNLPLDVRLLMERIRREGYSKEMVEEWIAKRNLEAENRREQLALRIDNLRWQFNWRRYQLLIMGIIALITTFIIVSRFFIQNFFLDRALEGMKSLGR